MEGIPFLVTYNPKLKSVNKVILKYLGLFYMDKEVKRVFPLKLMISFRSASHLVTQLFSKN